MSKYLVIIESPGKLKKIKSYLGSDYDIMASFGHVIDLPPKKIGVDLKKDFKPTYEIMNDKKDVVKGIVSKAKKAQIVYLMTDQDREGEAISYHISNQLPAGTKFKRARSGSITKNEIEDAIKNANDIDYDLVNAYECRRILDRIVGFKTSFLVTQATGGKSAGRVQSATLRILADREKEIQDFIPQTYFDINAELITDKFEKILGSIKIPNRLDITTEKQVIEICDTFKKGPVKVSVFNKNKYNAKPSAPFITSSLLQSASSFLGMNSNTAMKAAQELYEQGSITYMRTDSAYIIPDFINLTRTYIDTSFGKNYLPSASIPYQNKKNSQEAHEAIRPTDINVKLAGNTVQSKKLYEMIWKRMVSSQMTDAVYWKSSAEFKCGKYSLESSGSECIFEGWRKVWTYGGSKDAYLPILKVGDEVKVIEIKYEECQTKPPSRYSEASAIKKIEQLGIGRPSTYKTIFQTLTSRSYIENKSKSIKVTELGMNVSKFLVKSNFCFVDPKFTSNMEEKLDKIAQKKDNKLAALTEFWDRLKLDIINAKDAKEKMNQTSFKCECGSLLVKKHSKFGDFLGCSNYPNCKKIYNIGEDGGPVEKVKKELNESKHKCPNCGEKLLIRIGKKGTEYLGCRHWNKSKDCLGFFNMDGEKMEFKKKSFKKFKKWNKKKS